jgi:hypothetical protein
MKKTLTLFLLMMMILTLNACAPLVTATSAPLPTTEPAAFVETQIPIVVSPTEMNPSAIRKLYANNAFGLSFQYPSNWFVLDYVSDDTLRIEVGSDKVYPYGTDPSERINELTNSYNIVIQYTMNDQKPYWKEDTTYQSLLNLKDGESLSDARSLLIRVSQLDIGRFKGFEYITTLSETGQTDHFYSRSVMLFDEQTNDLVTIMGQPYNVEVSNGMEWRDVYRTIDEANLTFFHEIVESITLD